MKAISLSLSLYTLNDNEVSIAVCTY